MGDLTVRAKNEIEREKSFTPQESLEFLRNKVNFRFVSDGIRRELRRLGKSDNLKDFRQLMREKGVLSADGEQEKKWFEEQILPSKESAIKICFAFGLSSRKEEHNPETITAAEFLWNVCRINGFNYRCAEDIIYNYALDKGESFAKATELIKLYESQIADIKYDDAADETKGTYTLWRTFSNLSDWTEDEIITELVDNAAHFYRYNKSSKVEFQKLYKSLCQLLLDDIAEDGENAFIGKIEGYKGTGTKKKINLSSEIIFDSFIQALALEQQSKRGNHPDAARTVFGSIIDKFPTEYYIDEMKSTASNKKATTTDDGHGYVRKMFVLCFFLNIYLNGGRYGKKTVGSRLVFIMIFTSP